MKRLAYFSLTVILIIGGLFALNQSLDRATKKAESESLTIYNWGDYLAPRLIQDFEEEFNLRVIYETFDSNEAMYTKVKQAGTNYDLLIPSEYMIERMIEENLLYELDYNQIDGIENLLPELLDLPFDPKNQYSIPYFWGTLGIIYNDRLIQEKAITSWEDLWNPAYENQVLLIDGAREIVGLTLQSLGYSLNSKNLSELEEAKEKLNQLSPNVKAIVVDEIKMYMIQEEGQIAVSFSGEAADMMAENKHLHYLLPEEGSNLWFDSMVIPKTAQNKKGAHDFISFMLRPENAAQNAEYIGYSSPNQVAIDEELDSELIRKEQFYPDLTKLEHLEVYENFNLDFIDLYNEIFLEFKMN